MSEGRSAILVAFICLLLALVRMRGVVADSSSAAERPAAANPRDARRIAAGGDGQWLVGTDPFRFEPRAETRQEEPVTPDSSEPEFDLTVMGIAGGSPWRAVVRSSLLGVPARVVAVGDSLGPAVIESITSTGIVVRGPDSTRAVPFGRRGM